MRGRIDPVSLTRGKKGESERARAHTEEDRAFTTVIIAVADAPAYYLNSDFFAHPAGVYVYAHACVYIYICARGYTLWFLLRQRRKKSRPERESSSSSLRNLSHAPTKWIVTRRERFFSPERGGERLTAEGLCSVCI